jgi:hypothetical protein
MMAISFPNSSRSYDPLKRCVRFWGYDSTFEISFYLEEGALQKFSPQPQMDEAVSLRVFDGNRKRIEKAAHAAYERQRRSFYMLSGSDF